MPALSTSRATTRPTGSSRPLNAFSVSKVSAEPGALTQQFLLVGVLAPNTIEHVARIGRVVGHRRLSGVREEERRRRPIAQSLPLLAGLVSQAITTYLVLILAGRTLGAAAFGPLSALYVLLTSIATGLFLPLEQEIARLRGNQRGRGVWDAALFRRSTRLGLFGAAAAVAVVVLAFPTTLTILGHHVPLLVALCIALPGYAVCFAMRGELAGRRQLTRYGVQLGVEGAVRLAGTIVLVLAGVTTVGWYGAMFAGAPWVAAGVSAIGWQRPDGSATTEPSPPLARPVGLLVLSCLASQLLINAGPLVVALLAGPGERARVGAFLAALVVVRVPVFLFTAVQPSFLPAIAEYSAAGRRGAFVRLISRVLAAAAALVAVSSVAAVALGPWLLRTFFGFRQSVTNLSQWTFAEMTISVGLFLIAAVLAQALLGRGRHAATTVGWLIGLVGLAAGTAAGTGAVSRAGTGFLIGAMAATTALGVALWQDLRRWQPPAQPSLEPAVVAAVGALTGQYSAHLPSGPEDVIAVRGEDCVEPSPGVDERPAAAPSRVLIVVPTLGQRPELLSLTLQSLADQTDEPADVVVVVPAGATEARAVAAATGAAILDDPGSMSAAINLGFASATAAHVYVNWIGDDDLLTRGALGTAARALDATPGAVVAFGYCDYIDDVGRVLFTSRAGRLAPWLMSWGPDLVPQPGCLFRRDAVEAVGGVDSSLRYAMDLDLLLRLRRRGRFVNTHSTLSSFRWHASSTTVANRTPSLDEAELVKRRYLPAGIRRVAPLWERPVRGATRLAARRVNRLAQAVAR
jgi:O-antigen/teichoic acid export membrane protein/GT2 family glycosyltransferase